MFKYVAFFVLIVGAFATPVPDAKPDPEPKAAPKPGVLSYSAPLVSAPLAYSAAYTAPVAYSSYVAPSVYAAGYTAYNPYAYSAPLVVV